jgi:hypothetical protein
VYNSAVESIALVSAASCLRSVLSNAGVQMVLLHGDVS